MPQQRNRSFAFRQAKLALLIACSLGVVFSLVQVYVDYDGQRKGLETNVMHHADSVSRSAANALWELNDGLGNAIVSGLFGFQPIAAVTLKTTSNFVLAEGYRGVPPYPLRFLVDQLFGPPEWETFPLSYHDNGNVVPVGTLTVLCDPTSTAIEFFKRSLVIVVSGFVQSLLLGIALLTAFYLTLTRPLAALAGQLDRVDVRNDSDAKIIVSSDHDTDELGQIAAATNRHIDLIRSHLKGLNEAHHSLQNTNALLEQKVSERTVGLTHEISVREEAETRLRDALADAERSARVRTQFLANMSHELRTPLNAILGYSDYARLFLEKLDETKVREYLNHIHTSGSHLLALVNSILDLSRMDAGQMPVHPETFDLCRLIREVAAELRPVIDRNGNEIVCLMGDRQIEIVSDPTKARQVLYNLIGNAAKFTKEGRITISVHDIAGDAGRVMLEINDTGIGIAKSSIEAIFENFYQADSSMTRRYEGSGLGLAIVRNICKLLDWKVGVDSVVGEGSTFRLEIPTRHGVATDDESA